MTVYLVGAGPGDPGLLTVRGAEILRVADVVVYDRLVARALLDLAPPTALRIDVGKRPGGPLDQEEINALLVQHGRSQTVVRLKGGDPFVFGRGGEEAQSLVAAGVAFEVIPGVTSAIAVPAYAGIPVTHRGISTSFTVVTGHSRHEPDVPIDWDAIARAAGTIIVLMGVAHRSEIASRLIEAGRSPSTPVAAVHWGTRPEQRTVRTTLAALGSVPLEPPVTLVIGEVAALELGWFEQRPLFGRRVIVTRTREQSSDLSQRLLALGATPIELPVIEIEAPADGGAALAAAASTLDTYAWVVFASANAVRAVCSHLRDAREFGRAKVAAIGPGTAAALADFGVRADLVPTSAVAESLVEAIGASASAPAVSGRRLLIPRAEAGRDELPAGLEAAGWDVDVVVAYRTVPARPSLSQLAAVAEADAVTFTSSSTVTNFVKAVGVERAPAAVVCIGPVTAQTATNAGLRVAAVADPHTIEGLVTAVLTVLTDSSSEQRGSRS